MKGHIWRGGNNESHAGSGKHAGLGIDGFAEELGADERVVAAMFGKDALHEGGVGRDDGKNIVGGEVEETPDSVLLLGLQGNAALAFEQGIGSPGGAPKYPGRIGAGGHGVEIAVELGYANGLGLIDREKKVGGGTEDIGTAFAGEELELSIAKPVGIALGRLPQATRADAGVEGGFNTVHTELGLRLEGGRDGDDAPATLGVAKEQPGEEMGLQFILAGLARQDDHEGEATVMKDGVFDSAGNLDLVGTQMDVAGMRTEDGGTANGGADLGGKSKHFSPQRSLRTRRKKEILKLRTVKRDTARVGPCRV